ncbi:hypothetical protein [Leuconostoc citreum]|uniref:hypothetical protein n=1 Tax=Leuconostoc citreum TaxID=33964 RepID=UPI0032DF748F
MMTKQRKSRNAQLNKYLKALNEFNWHHPEAYEDELKTNTIRNYQDYYTAQVALILVNNYLESIEQVATLLEVPVATVYRLIKKYHQDFDTLREVKEAIENGKDW